MLSNCKEINLALKFSIESGNDIKEISEGWTNAKKVFHMKKKLTQDLKEKIGRETKNLEYWKDEGSPHNSPEGGYFCNECKIGISFPD